MKRCYIAGKIGDLPLNEFMANFEEAKKEVEALGMIPISPIDLPHNHGRTWSEYMREDLTAMLTCDCVYAQRNCNSSPGATAELQVAALVRMDVIHQKQIQLKPINER